MAHLGKSSIFWYRTYKMNGHIWRCRQSTFKRYIEKIHCTIHSWGSTWTLKRILGSHSFHPDAQWRIDQIDHHPPEIIQIFLLYIEHSSIIMESLVSLILTYSKYYILYIYIIYIYIYIPLSHDHNLWPSICAWKLGVHSRKLKGLFIGHVYLYKIKGWG
jgi:hypothetical protein